MVQKGRQEFERRRIYYGNAYTIVVLHRNDDRGTNNGG